MEDPEAEDSSLLLEELSHTLEAITSSNGKNSFNVNDVKAPRSVFIVVHNKEGKAAGYHVIDNYGKYAGRSESICFKKSL